MSAVVQMRGKDRDGAAPFPSVRDAWFWTMQELTRRQGGRRREPMREDQRRPCSPDDVMKVLDRLYRERKIGLHHARVLRAYGESQVEPDAKHATERGDALIWAEAMQRMEWPLRVKGIVK